MIKERKAGETEPTEGQKSAGNYFKAHKSLHGMRISLENEAGTTRRGVGKDGKPWKSKMAHDYGYIRGTTGKDKDHLDVFLGPEADNPGHKVYIIDQDDDDGNFDEHKVMMGFPSSSAAYSAYHANYPEGYKGFGDMAEADLPTFKKWAFSGKGAKRTRASEMKYFSGGGSVSAPTMEDVQNFCLGGGVETKDFAKGGTVTGQETVGLGTFGGADQQNLVAQTPSNAESAGVGAGSGGSSSGATGNFQGVDFIGGVAQPVAGDQTYSSAGLSRTLSTPYTQGAGIARPSADLGFNPGSVDPLLSAQLQMGDRGGIQRGATGFLGAGFNPWTLETGPSEGEQRAPANQDANIDALFDLAGSLGIDTSGYSRSANPVGIRGERSGGRDTMALYDAVNDATKNYLSVDHMTPDGKSMERTMYMERDGRLVPISSPTRRSGRQDSAFFDDSFKEMVMTIGPALLGGFGGWAGLMGQAGTAAAPYINAAGNAVVGGLRGGTQGALSSLAGSAGGVAGGAAATGALGSAYDNIGRQIGSRLGSALYNNERRS